MLILRFSTNLLSIISNMIIIDLYVLREIMELNKLKNKQRNKLN